MQHTSVWQELAVSAAASDMKAFISWKSSVLTLPEPSTRKRSVSPPAAGPPLQRASWAMAASFSKGQGFSLGALTRSVSCTRDVYWRGQMAGME